MRRQRNKQEEPNQGVKKSPESAFDVQAPKFTSQEIKTFKQQACEVLDILDKTGDGIYAEGRYPGMYLKHQNNALSQKIIDKMSERVEEKQEDEDNIKLLNFFKSQQQK